MKRNSWRSLTPNYELEMSHFGEIYSILGYVISTSKLAQVESIFCIFARLRLVRLNVVFVKCSLVHAIELGTRDSSDLGIPL